MIKITYLEHSGFAVECDDYVLIFDYYKGNLPQFDKDKKICVFASHVHYDHFKKKIFTWAEEYENIHYILSDDIEAAGPKAQTEHIGADADFNIWDLRIHTLKSTDEGVAFLVRVKEKTFFHAGDLNWWYWEEEDDETWNEPMRQAYHIRKRLQKSRVKKLIMHFSRLIPDREKSLYLVSIILCSIRIQRLYSQCICGGMTF